MHAIRLGDTASPPVKVNVQRPASFASSLAVTIAGDPDIPVESLRIAPSYAAESIESSIIANSGSTQIGTLELRNVPANVENHWLPILLDDQVVGHMVLGNPFTRKPGPPLGERNGVQPTLPAIGGETDIDNGPNQAPSLLIATTVVVFVLVIAGVLLIWRSQKLTINNF
jgi:hypothetical protein